MHVAHPSHIENITFSLSCCPRRNQTCNLLELPEQEISLMKELPGAIMLMEDMKAFNIF